jgi:tetratricopeptide (TPR) repeat protein
MAKLFQKKEIFKVKSVPVDPTTMGEPSTADEYQKRGMAFYARKKYNDAEVDLQKAISLEGNNIDSYYTLGMVLKALDHKEEAVQAFTKALDMIKTNPGPSSAKYDMLKRLALGHINEMTQGDWNLEKEIWKHIE